MSKSIYKEALEIVDESLYQQDNSVIFNHLGLNLLKKSLEQAQKQEQLLELYRQLVKDLGLVIEHDTTDTWDGPEDYEYLEINYDSIKSLNTYKQIKELENDK